jgi:hypothetical protein
MQEAPMNPISQIELNARFRDLERQVATARQSQGAVLDWLKMLWRKRPRTAHRAPRHDEISAADANACSVNTRPLAAREVFLEGDGPMEMLARALDPDPRVAPKADFIAFRDRSEAPVAHG